MLLLSYINHSRVRRYLVHFMHILSVLTYKELKYREEVVPVDLFNRRIGISEGAESIAKLLTRMCLKSEVVEGGKCVKVEIPPTRAGLWSAYFAKNLLYTFM